MKTSDTYFENLKEFYAEVKAHFDKVNGLQSFFDRELSRIYHAIEANEFSVTEGNDYAQELKVILHRRRAAKDEVLRLQPVYLMLKEQIDTVTEQYDRAVRKGVAVRQSLNSTLPIEEVLEAVGK